jgi:hypothetical protein
MLCECHAAQAEPLVVLRPALKAHSSTEQGYPLRRVTFFAPEYEKYSPFGNILSSCRPAAPPSRAAKLTLSLSVQYHQSKFVDLSIQM